MREAVVRTRSPRCSWAFLPVLLLFGACDPCFGTGACVDPHIYAEGRLIWHLDGQPASGVRIEFQPREWVGITADTLRTFSNGEGIFRLRLGTGQHGEMVGTLVLHPPEPYNLFGFEVHGVRLRTTDVRGNAQFIGYWGVGPLRTDPHISYVGELWFAESGERADGIEVEFRRTGGLPVVPDTFVTRSDQFGRFGLFMKPSPLAEGEVIGDIHVRPDPPFQSFVLENARMATMVGLNEIRLLGIWSID